MEMNSPNSHGMLPLYLASIFLSIIFDAAQAFGQARVALNGARRLHDVLVLLTSLLHMTRLSFLNIGSSNIASTNILVRGDPIRKNTQPLQSRCSNYRL